MPQQLVAYVATALAEGMGIRAAGRVFGLDPDTVLRILRAVGAHAARVDQHFLQQGLSVRECQLDELWTFVAAKAIVLDGERALRNISGDIWIWIALDAECKLALAWHVGGRTSADAFALFAQLKCVLPDAPLLFTADDLPHYAQPILQTYGVLVTPPRTGRPGRPRAPFWAPSPSLRYAQIIKRRERDQVIEKRVVIVFGDQGEIQDLLAENGQVMNTSYVERRNLTLRHDNRRLTRKTLSFSKREEMLTHQLSLSFAYTHFVRPHASLTVKTPNLRTKAQTPMMAKGLTDHIWTMDELLSFPLDANAVPRN